MRLAVPAALRSVVLVAGLVSGSLSVCAQNLLVNGSFETPALSSGTFTNYTLGQTVGAGWVMGSSTNGGDIVNTPRSGFLNAQLGSQIFYFDSQGTGSISQTLTLTAGTSYQLSLYLAGWNTLSGQVTASVAGGSDTFSSNFTTPDNSAWYYKSMGFTPTSTGTYTVTLTGGTPSSSFDNVTLVAVPEPPVTSLAIAALAGVLPRLRRRTRAT